MPEELGEQMVGRSWEKDGAVAARTARSAEGRKGRREGSAD